MPGYGMTEVFMVSSFSKGSLDKNELAGNAVSVQIPDMEYATGFPWQQQSSHLQSFSPSQKWMTSYLGVGFFYLSQNDIPCCSFCFLNDF